VPLGYSSTEKDSTDKDNDADGGGGGKKIICKRCLFEEKVEAL